jgi:hypothetical protein
MMKSKIGHRITSTLLNKLVSLFLLLFLFSTFRCSQQPKEEGPLEVTSKLVRSFVTADTALFYSAVEIDSVVDHMNRKVWHNSDNRYVVREILFFKYAPLKISKTGLQKRIDHPFPYSHFEFDSVTSNEESIRYIIKWQEVYDDSLKSLILTLYEKEPNVWKIKAIDFP